MSHLFKSMGFEYLNEKDNKDLFPSDEDYDSFNFQYIPANHLRSVIKNVQRQQMKANEVRSWESFLKQQQFFDSSDVAACRLRPTSRTNSARAKKFLENTDSELRRLKEDSMPETKKQLARSSIRTKRTDGPSMEATGRKSPRTKEIGTGSGNVFLMIPEDDDASHCYNDWSRVNAKLLNVQKKITSTDSTGKRDGSRKLTRAMYDLDNNSSPETSLQRGSEREAGFFVRPDPIVTTKILAMQKKVSAILDEISFKLDRIPVPDGEEDLSRRLRRVTEFSVRFCRNYLYELGRQITTIRRHARAFSPTLRPRPTTRSLSFHLHAIGQKMITAHQILIQALGAYCKHIPSSVVRGHPGKLKDILQMVTDLKDTCNEVNICSDYYGSGDADTQPMVNEIHGKCAMILSKLQSKGFASDNDSQSMIHRTHSTVAVAQFSEAKKRTKQKDLSSRFSMYSMQSYAPRVQLRPRRPPHANLHKDRKHVDTMLPRVAIPRNYPLAHGKLNPSLVTVKSWKENTRHVQKPTRPLLPVTKNPQTSSRNPLRNSQIRPPPREDDIRTMMDAIPPDSDVNSSVEMTPIRRYVDTNSLAQSPKVSRDQYERQSTPPKRGISSVRKPSEKEIIDDQELTRKIITITEKHLSTLVPVIADLMSLIAKKRDDIEIGSVSSASLETLRGFLKKYQSHPRTITKCPETNHSMETRTGPKNMMLISLPYNESPSEEEEFEENDSCYQADRKTKLELSEKILTADPVKLHDSKKRTERLDIPEAFDVIIPEYRHRYQNYTKESPMYISNTNNKPWDVVAWIADKLVNELVVEISKELQMDNVIKRLFDLEFQDF